jgi:hypothetical protein
VLIDTLSGDLRMSVRDRPDPPTTLGATSARFVAVKRAAISRRLAWLAVIGWLQPHLLGHVFACLLWIVVIHLL